MKHDVDFVLYVDYLDAMLIKYNFKTILRSIFKFQFHMEMLYHFTCINKILIVIHVLWFKRLIFILSLFHYLFIHTHSFKRKY